jgi:hypothetical protein
VARRLRQACRLRSFMSICTRPESGLGYSALGFMMAIVSVMTPALIDLRSSSVAARRFFVQAAGQPLWQKVYLDVALILAAGATYWHSASTGTKSCSRPKASRLPPSIIRRFLRRFFSGLDAACSCCAFAEWSWLKEALGLP